MKFTLNEKPREVASNQISITEMLCLQKLDMHTGIAVAVDQEIVPKANWPTHYIQENQKVLIITATQGG